MRRAGYLDLSHGQVHYRRSGEGPTVLLIHGAAAGSSIWGATVDALAARNREAIAIDLPGAGLSAALPAPPTLQSWAVCCKEAMELLGRPRYVVVGHHTGAAVALELARRAPDRVAGVLACGMPILSAAEIARLSVEKAPTADEDAGELLTWWATHWQLTAETPRRGAIVAAAAAEMLAWGKRRPQGHHALAAADLEGLLGATVVPTRILAGSEEILRETSGRAATFSDAIDFEELGETGFYVADEEPGLLSDALLKFEAERIET